MDRLRLTCLLLAAALSSWPDAALAARPRVGLVLGGGGARGGAHLGVLEVLEELRVPFDCVAGTSMGALAASAYVAGASPAEIEDKIRRADWDRMFDDSAGREALTLRRKEIDDRFFSGLEFGVSRNGLRFREGAVSGERIKLFFNDLVRADLGERDIEDLPLPLSILATDIGTGERVAIRTGNLTTAMRASMSVPGVIAPVLREGRKLVDGGLTDNLPVQEVRERCGAEVVIAVNVGSPLLKPEQVTGVVSVVGQVVNLLTEQNVAKSRALLRPGDIYLAPDLGDIGASDFKRQLEAARLGRAAALAAGERLRALSVPPAEYRTWRARVRLPTPPQPPRVDEIRVDATRFVNPREIREGVRQKEGEPLDAKALADDLVLLYSRGDLTRLDYAVLRERDRTILRLTPVEKPWGPDYLRFGLNLSSDFRTESPYSVRALYRRTWLDALGAEWLTVAQLGSNQQLGTEFYQPLDERQRWFVRPFARVELTKAGIYLGGDRVAEYRLRTARAGVDAGLNLGIYGRASVGWLERNLSSTLDTGPTVFPNFTLRYGGPTAAVALDTQDFAFFPTRGYQASATYFEGRHVSEGVDRYGRAEARLAGAWSIGDLVLLGSLEGGKTTHGSAPLGDTFALGGQRRLSAYAPGQILGGEYALGTVQAQWRLTRPLPVLGLSLFGGLSYETGRMRELVTEPTLTGRLDSYGVYLAANTLFGPLYVGYADTGGRPGRFYLFVGTP